MPKSNLDTVQADEIQLRRASIHLYEIAKSGGLTLQPSGMPVDTKTVFQPDDFAQFASYFKDLTADAIHTDSKTHKAKFDKRDSDSVCAQVSTLFNNPNKPDEFHALSIEMANQLLNVTPPAAAQKASYIIFAEFAAAAEICYAILKLDYDVHIAVDLGSPSTPPRVLVHARDLPTSTELKDKFAFLVKPGTRQEYELLVTDRKYQRRQGRHIVAKYFLRDFLGASFVEDARFMTEQFIDVTQSFARRKTNEIKLDLFYTGLQHFVCRDSVQVQEFLHNTLPDQPGLQNELREELRSAGLSTASFDVDHTYVAERTSRRRINLSNGISIAGEREVMDQHISIKMEEGHYQFGIEAPAYTES